MRYFPVRLLTEAKTGEDILGNPVTELQETAQSYRGRFSEWTADEIALLGRDGTQSQRKLLTDAPLSVCKAASGLRADADYTIKAVKDLHGRWRLLYVERWRA
ncbi:MAG: hypothetical protein IJ496_04485 [Ruminococcus sp.]|nr:hypothetical protein [Ruminococcus sp.]